MADETTNISEIAKNRKSLSIIFPFLICSLASLFYVYDYFIQVAPSVMTQQLMQSFNIGAAGLGILSASFYYSYTLMQIPAGLMLDRLGARKILFIAVLVSALGVLLFGTATQLSIAGIARFLIGFGSSFAFISALFLASRWFSHRYFAFIAGLVQLGGCLGSMFGLAPLATMVNHLGWRQAMIIIGLITFVLSILFWLIIRDGRSSELHTTNTMNNEWQRIKSLFRYHQVWLVSLCGLFSWVPVAVIGALWGVPYLMKIYNWSNVTAGNVVMLFWLGLGLGSPLIGWYSNYINRRCQPFLICFVIGFIAAILVLLAPSLPVSLVVISFFFLGFSASVQSLSFGFIKDIVPSTMFGTASGLNNMAAIIGGGISQPLVGFILAERWHGKMVQHVPVYSINDYRIGFLIIPVVMILGVFVTRFFLKETYCRVQFEQSASADSNL